MFDLATAPLSSATEFRRSAPGAAAIADLSAAIALVSADPEASRLVQQTSEAPETDSPLASWLYLRWWMGVPAVADVTVDHPLVAQLEARRRASADVVADLLVLATDGVQIIVGRRGTRQATALSADAVVGSSRPGCLPRPGDLVSAFAGSGEVDPTGGWWWARTGLADPEGPLDRWYLAVDAASAPAVVEAVVTLSGRTGVPLSVKCPPCPSAFDRQDACVLYLPRAQRGALEPLAESWSEELGSALGRSRPPFTSELAPGIAAAQDPGGQVSYGQLRCGQVAAAIVLLGGRAAPAERLHAALADVGIAADRPGEVS